MDAEIMEAEIVGEAGNLPAVTSGRLPDTVDVNETLTLAARKMLEESGRTGTRDTYFSVWTSFAQWCVSNGRAAAIPTKEGNLTSWVAALIERDTPPTSVRRAIAAVQWMNRRAGNLDLDDRPAKTILADHRHAWAKAGRETKTSAPVHLDRLEVLLAACDESTPTGRRDRAVMLLGFFIRARASELAALRNRDLELHDGDELLVVTKRTSKADKQDEGIEYDIDDPTCIAAVKAWKADLAAQKADAPGLPFFRSVTRHGTFRKPGGKLVKGPNGKGVRDKSGEGDGITRQTVNALVKAAAERAGLFGEFLPDGTSNPAYVKTLTAHGLRAGAPTELGRSTDMTVEEIMEALGDWKSADVMGKYVKRGRRDGGRSGQDRHRAAAMSQLRLDRADRVQHDA
ncbi:hypothetical protein [Streptomyces sp. NBC_01314]|uniref:hypothetical protein n=1 Tax=Streptomyces sp. NBC_01314 TaxID=2903821 RepID=UPI0030906ED3|nr:hypothetical protein OG622_10885 [Streptomyces sp. NBC_01314]